MTLTNRWNRVRYQLYAPIYDAVAWPLEQGRKRAIERLDPDQGSRILIVGCGTGSDLAYLPEEGQIVGIDLTPAMIQRTRERAEKLERQVSVGISDAHRLPFEDGVFDAVLLHLVLSVVPDPKAVVEETARVLTEDGRISIYDKFRPVDGKPALPRRLANPLARLLFADLNRPLEPMVADAQLAVERRETLLGGLYTVTTASPVAEA